MTRYNNRGVLRKIMTRKENPLNYLKFHSLGNHTTDTKNDHKVLVSLSFNEQLSKAAQEQSKIVIITTTPAHMVEVIILNP